MERDRADEVIRQLFRSWYSSLVNYGLRYCGSMERAEDAAQAAFMALYRDLLAGRHYDRLEGWTLRVVQRELSRARRIEWRSGNRVLSLLDVGDINDEHSPDEKVRAETEEMQAILSLLTPREQEVLLLRIETRRYAEIASELGISRNTVKTLLARSLRKIRRLREQPGTTIGEEVGSAISKTLQ